MLIFVRSLKLLSVASSPDDSSHKPELMYLNRHISYLRKFYGGIPNFKPLVLRHCIFNKDLTVKNSEFRRPQIILFKFLLTNVFMNQLKGTLGCSSYTSVVSLILSLVIMLIFAT